MKDPRDEALTAAGGDPLAPQPDDPPIVARMVVEIRSDGSRTVARGAIEDLLTGERVGVKAEGTTPLSLARSLAASLIRVPSLARRAVRGLLGERRR